MCRERMARHGPKRTIGNRLRYDPSRYGCGELPRPAVDGEWQSRPLRHPGVPRRYAACDWPPNVVLNADELIAAAHRAQADAVEIEVKAKRRLADEYDAAQARCEVGQCTGRPKVVPLENDFAPATANDLGLTRKAIHEARQLLDAEAAAPGVIRRALDARLADGQEPIKVAVERTVAAFGGPWHVE